MTKEEAIERLKQGEPFSELYDEKWETALNMAIEALQAQKTGKWIKETKHYKDQFQEFNYCTIKCSVCGSAPEKNWHLTNYCPNCGCRMVEQQESENKE